MIGFAVTANPIPSQLEAENVDRDQTENLASFNIHQAGQGIRACSSAGRAPPLQGGGPGSESQQVH